MTDAIDHEVEAWLVEPPKRVSCGYCKHESAAALAVRLMERAIDAGRSKTMADLFRFVEQRHPTGHRYSKFCTHLKDCTPDLLKRFRAIA